jgi:hypothetical protein
MHRAGYSAKALSTPIAALFPNKKGASDRVSRFSKSSAASGSVARRAFARRTNL